MHLIRVPCDPWPGMPDMGATKRCGDRDNPAGIAPNIHMKIGIGITSALSVPGCALFLSGGTIPWEFAFVKKPVV